MRILRTGRFMDLLLMKRLISSGEISWPVSRSVLTYLMDVFCASLTKAESPGYRQEFVKCFLKNPHMEMSKYATILGKQAAPACVLVN